MAKNTTNPIIINRLLAISIKDLKKLNLLKQDFETRVTLKFSSTNSINKLIELGSISIHVYTVYGHNYIEFEYVVNGQNIKSKIELELFPSNLGGGFVTYFLCPKTGKRCSKLYLDKKYFVSRYAIRDGCYYLQTESKKTRNNLLAIRAFQKYQKIAERYRNVYLRNCINGIMSPKRSKVEDAFIKMNIYEEILLYNF